MFYQHASKCQLLCSYSLFQVSAPTNAEIVDSLMPFVHGHQQAAGLCSTVM